ncbi:MAG: hypothetical protein ACHQC8_03100 [Solirubrobacterales bacterium]
MLKRQVEIGGEYAWQDQYSFSPNEYRKVTVLKFLNKPGSRHVLVRDKDGEFETHLERLIKPWSALGPKGKESEFRTHAEKHEHERRLAQERDPVGFEIEKSWRALSPFKPGKGGVPRVPEWLPRMFNDMASGVLKLDMGQYQVVQDEQMACYEMLQNMVDVCERIRDVAREMLPAWEAEDKEAQYPRSMAMKVQRRLNDGDLPFASSEIMPVYGDYGMSRSRATTQYRTGSTVAADFMERVADDYEELDLYASLAVRWGWGFYLRWRTTHEAEILRTVPRTGRRSGRRP